jgi:hypothetical protein
MARRLLGYLGVLLILSSIELGCQGRTVLPDGATTQQAPWFEDITSASGLAFIHDAGPTGSYFLPQIIGSGAALFDFDGDGRLDILLLQNAGPSSQATNRLYRQLQDGTFRDVSAGSGLDFAGHCMGVAIGDINNDGWPDVLITCYGGVRLFLNHKGDGTFIDVTRAAGLDSISWGTSAAFLDYDRDGWLDLVIVNYLEYDPSRACLNARDQRDYCHPNSFTSAVPRLYRNMGRPAGAPSSQLQFENVTVKAGLARHPGNGLGVVCADFDGDGWPDIFVTNDAGANRLWINRHDGTFTEEATQRGLAYNNLGQPQGNMGIALADVAGSGTFDLFVTHLTEETHTLWRQGPRGQFQDRTGAAGLANPRWRGTGFGTVLADFDHDGYPDLAVVNGRVSQAKFGMPDHATLSDPFWARYAERNQLFANAGNGRFRDISEDNPPFCRQPNVARALCCGDIDGDGAVDLLVTTVAGTARLYRNIAPKEGRHWLLVRALDPALHRDAYGAEIRVQAGGRHLLGWVNPGSSYLSSNDPRAHFGLGSADHFDSIHVLWPDGWEEDFAGGEADRALVLQRGSGRK